MKLPKNFGFGAPNMADMMKQAQSAMDRAKNLEDELAGESFELDKGPIKVTFDGRGAMTGLKIVDKSVVDLDDLEMLEDMIVAAARDGFQKATEIRQKKVDEIMPNMPDIPGLKGLI
ncbi:MAG: YbaB/EbfC family nucleoid-associated protein [Chthonomonas sp.]|nr:YbaB/EbfC family nucleoid-associated protein [Chthonomonas sp.]